MANPADQRPDGVTDTTPAPRSAPAYPAPAASPLPAVPARPRRSRILTAGITVGLLVVGSMWWWANRSTSATANETAVPAAGGVATVRITAPESAGKSGAGIASDAPPTKAAGSTPGKSRQPAQGSKPPTTTPSPSASPKAAVNPSGANLALGQSAVSSSIEGPAWAAANAVDGAVDSRWSSAFSDPQWLRVDLGKSWEINEIRVRWENAYAVAYRMELSTDRKEWKSVYSTTSGQGGDVTIEVDQVPARYVRMYGTKRSGQYGYSLLELEVS